MGRGRRGSLGQDDPHLVCRPPPEPTRNTHFNEGRCIDWVNTNASVLVCSLRRALVQIVQSKRRSGTFLGALCQHFKFVCRIQRFSCESECWFFFHESPPPHHHYCIIMGSGDTSPCFAQSDGGDHRYLPAVTARHLPLFLTPPSFFLRANTNDYPEKASQATTTDPGFKASRHGLPVGAPGVVLPSTSLFQWIRRKFPSKVVGQSAGLPSSRPERN